MAYARDILVIDDQDRIVQLLRRALPDLRVRGPARDAGEALGMVADARGRVQIVLLDMHFDLPAERLVGSKPDMTARELEGLRRRQGLHILSLLRERYPELPVLLMTSQDEVDLAEVREAEDYTYFLDNDGVDLQSLRAQIEGILSAREGAESEGPVYWGQGLAMRRLRQRLHVLARGRLPVTLLGETGTGKSLLARHVLHARSGRGGRFVAVDLSTLPVDLVSAHLFGSVKGAYTGSIADRTGAFEAADGGTLFLDEVGNLSSDAQKMLLGVLQDGVVTRVGDLRERPVDVKVVVATNDDLMTRVREGTFRADLAMRLNPATAVRLPPLRERGVDWASLLTFTLSQSLARPVLRDMVQDYAESVGADLRAVQVYVGSGVPEPAVRTLWMVVPDRSLRRIRQHAWPGNLRELSMVMENAALFALAEASGVHPGERPDVVMVRPKIFGDLLDSSDGGPVSDGDVAVRVRIEPQDSLNKVAVSCEVQYFTELFLREEGDFGRMALRLLGDPDGGRKVQLRFNQLGLKVRALREKLR